MRFIAFLFAFTACSLIAQGQTFEMFEGDTINYKDAMGKKQGNWKVFNKTKKLPGYKPDQVVEEGEYKDSKKIGVWKRYYSNGKVKDEITYKFNRPNGPYKTFYVNGQLEEEGMWKNSRNVGGFKRYHSNGKISQEFNFSTTGKRQGQQKYYYENGQVMIEGDWNGGKETGVLTEYYENGDVKAKKVFNEGQMDEAQTQNFAAKSPVKDAIKEEEKAAPVKEVVAQKSEKPNHGHFDGNGYYKLYNTNKMIVKDGIFKNYRLIDGKWYKYSEDGILINIERIKNGRYIGDVPFDEE